MDEEDILALLFLLTILSLPLTLVLITTSLIAYSRTKKWAASNQAASSSHLPSDPESSSSSSASLLATTDNDSDSDYLDTEDEAEQTALKAEAEADKRKTFAQMWRKEFGRVWTGKGVRAVAREREREERRKLARAVARELDRRERRRERKAAAAARERDGGDGLELEVLPPKYEK